MNTWFAFLCRITAIVVLFLLPGKNIYSQDAGQKELNGFRKAVWGSSMDQVRLAETETYMQQFHGFGIDALSYEGDIAGLTARIDYSFKNGKLFEGSYVINPQDNIKPDFRKLRDFLVEKFGKPDYRAGLLIDSDSIWIKVTDYGEFKGPELYWKFADGFIGLIASRFDNNITLTILYSSDTTIVNYGKDRFISTDTYEN
jgi:hypothetical protein